MLAASGARPRNGPGDEVSSGHRRITGSTADCAEAGERPSTRANGVRRPVRPEVWGTGLSLNCKAATFRPTHAGDHRTSNVYTGRLRR